MDFDDFFRAAALVLFLFILWIIAAGLAFVNVVEDCDKFGVFSFQDKVYECREISHDTN